MLNYRMCGAPWMLNYRNQGASWMLSCRIYDVLWMSNYPGCTLNFELQKPGCILKVRSHKHLALNYKKKILSHFSVLLHFMHGHWIPNEAPMVCTEYQKLQYPYCVRLMTLVTLLWLSVALFWQHVFTRSVPQKIKAPLKVNPFSVFLFSDWSGLSCTDQSISGKTKLQTVWILQNTQ